MGLNGDAMRGSPPVNQVAIERVEWWAQLVRPALLEFFPAEYAGPAVDVGARIVVALTRDGRAHGVRFGGEELWTHQTHNRFQAGPLIREGTVYVPGGDGVLYALDLRTGREKWQYQAGEELVTVPVVSVALVLVTSQTDTVFAVERVSGKWVWQYRRDAPSGFTIRGASGVAVAGDAAYVGFADGHLVALALADGQVRWDVALSPGGQFGDVDTTPLVDEGGRLYVASYRDGLFELDAATGERRWQSKVSGINHLVKRGGLLFATGADRIEAHLATNGLLFWSLLLKDAAQAPVLAQNYLAVPTGGELLFVDLLTGRRLLEWDPGPGVTAPAAYRDGSLYVLSNSGTVYSLDLANPS
jgi:outer membrane protein assembly factor BamB